MDQRLQFALDRAGGPAALARAMKVPTSAIARWRKAGIEPGYWSDMEKLFGAPPSAPPAPSAPPSLATPAAPGALRAQVPSVSAALQALDRMGRELTDAKTYESLRRTIKEARAIQVLFAEVDSVKAKAEDVVLDATIRIGQEPEQVLPAPAGRKTKSVPAGEPISGKAGTGIPKASRARLTALARAPRPWVEAMKIQLRDSKKDVTPTAIVKILEDEAKAARRRAAYEAGLRDGCTVADLEALAASGFRAGAILADPPWAFETYSDKGEGRSPEYKTMSVAEIAALPVDALAAADCVLCLWSVWHDLPGALRVIAAWGFTIKTGGFVWVKQNPSGEGLFMSKGYWTRPNSELCLLATRGNPLRLNADVHQVVLSPVGKHSVKPDCVHERIERLAPGPYLELFGRRLHPHWTGWGDEIPRDALAESGGGLEVHQEAAE